MYHIFVCGHLGCFHLLAIINNSAVNICVQVSVWTYIFISLGYSPRIPIIAVLYDDCLIIWGISKLLSKAAVPLHIPTSSVWGSQCLHIFVTVCYLTFWIRQSSGCAVAPHDFDLHSLMEMRFSVFSYIYWPLLNLWRNVCSELLPIFKIFGLFVFLLLSCKNSFIQ